MEEKNFTPSQYFDYIKESKNTLTTEALKESYGVFIKLAEKYNKLGQIESLKKLSFLASLIPKEEKLIELGITTFVYKDVIEDYIEHVADKTVKIVELSRYMREVPDELVEVVEKTREYFDEYYVVFTDYTGKEERKVEQERRDKDPILFGVFKNSTNVSDRFYFLGDWIDEYCDLTLDKMVEQYKDSKGYEPTHNITIPNTSEELIDLLKSYELDNSSLKTVHLDDASSLPVSSFKMVKKQNEKKESFFQKIRTIFTQS